MKLIQKFRNIIFIMRYKAPVVCAECGGSLSHNIHFERNTGFHRLCAVAYHERREGRGSVQPEERNYESMTKDDVLHTLRAACDFLYDVQLGGYPQEYLRERGGETHKALAGMALFFLEKEEWYLEERTSSPVKRVLET